MAGKYHVFYVTGLGQTIVEKAETYADEAAAIKATADQLFRDDNGNINPSGTVNPLYVETIDGKHVMILSVDHFLVVPEGEIQIREVSDGNPQQ